LQAKQNQSPPYYLPRHQVPFAFAACGANDFKAVSLQKIAHAPFRCRTQPIARHNSRLLSGKEQHASFKQFQRVVRAVLQVVDFLQQAEEVAVSG
jgi:hypothetical protein